MTDTEALTTRSRPDSRNWLLDGLLVLVLLLGAYFRFVGVAWDEAQYLHPDERFLIMVESSIEPVKSLGEYFDTAISSLNPNNRGHGFFVYGTLPIFVVRYLAEWLARTGYGEIFQVGRPLSALVDLGTVLLVYLVAARMYSRRVGVLAAAFSAFTVLHIQLAHFFKEDTFMTFFTFLTVYFAVRVATGDVEGPVVSEGTGSALETESPSREIGSVTGQFGLVAQAVRAPQRAAARIRAGFHADRTAYLLFGVALGMAVASKLNAAPVAFALPLAVLIRLNRMSPREQRQALPQAVIYLALAAAVSLLTFRILQPYAFQGPGFFSFKLNPQWLDNLRALRSQASPDSIFSFPPSLQWANRPVWFSWVNMVLWGFGLPLGLLAWSGFLWAGWRMLKGDWKSHLLLWIWISIYFAWQSMVFNPTMRYQLPVYPALSIFAAWGIFEFYTLQRATPSRFRFGRIGRAAAVAIGVMALLATFVWAWAFTRIYTRPVTRVAASRWVFQNVPGPINLHIQTPEGEVNQPLPFPADYAITAEYNYSAPFSAHASGILHQVYLHNVVDRAGGQGPDNLNITIAANPDGELVLSSGSVSTDIPHENAGSGVGIPFKMEPGVALNSGETYYIFINQQSTQGAAIGMSGEAIANESSWDDGLPLRMDGFDPFGGIYQGGLSFEMYWEDNQDKVERFVTTLNRADYVLITSSRQWGSVGRLPEKYPLTTAYYRALLGCPQDRSIEWCFNVAQVGTFDGQLGFTLEQVFDSSPNFGPLKINDQFAEEAFTVYDHPKVFIFRKDEGYDPHRVAEFFEGINIASVDPGSTGGELRSAPKTLLLPPERLVHQREGGTWSALFPAENPLNRSQALGTIVWYLALLFLGCLAYPLAHAAFPGLRDHGYPLGRMLALLLLAYLVWLAGSFEIPFNRLTISGAVGVIALVSGLYAYTQRDEIRFELRSRRAYYLAVEGLFLAFFLAGLLIRFGNPDLWHPWKGGEKPMDFSYFNAVLKSTTFPPYDPWYAGGYINYYYYGFVLVGVLVKWLGIVPAFAYNLILPTLFALIAMGAFTFGWNLVAARPSTTSGRPGANVPTPEDINEGSGNGHRERTLPLRLHAFGVGLAASLGMAVLGNLGTLRMIFRGYQRLASPGIDLAESGLLSRAVWTVEGFFRAVAGTPLPYALADWYWNPSRAIEAETGNPITEFPFFTVLYADLHAHLIALPITLMVLVWGLSIIRARGRWRGPGSAVLGFLVGGLAIGALRPTNTWDFYPYLALGALAVAYTYGRFFRPIGRLESLGLPDWALRAAVSAGAVILLTGLGHFLYQPFADWYAQGYSQVELWRYGRTGFSDYITHWGLFVFIISTWMVWETREWMANTPLSALRKLEPYQGIIIGGLVTLLGIVVALVWWGVHVAWLVLPLAAWAGLLLLRPGQPENKRVVLFLIGTGLSLTLMVETIVLRGDIGRMNTVFKFYLQAWTLLALSAAGSLGWLIAAQGFWTVNWRRVWQVAVVSLAAAAALYPVVGGLAKVRDRMSEQAPATLDGMLYMNYAEYNDLDTILDLSQDYRAIRWMQEHVRGSPVIVEANSLNLYHWFTRFTINTGLPGVVGWDWHQRQQREFVPVSNVTGRVHEIDAFYQTEDVAQAVDFLRQYDVEYIIIGQLERARYPGPGLEKFPAFNGVYWRDVYRDNGTTIYQVIEPLQVENFP